MATVQYLEFRNTPNVLNSQFQMSRMLMNLCRKSQVSRKTAQIEEHFKNRIRTAACLEFRAEESRNNFAKSLKFLGENLIKTKPASESNRRNRTVPGEKQLFGLSPCRSFEEAGVSFLRSRGNPTCIARARRKWGLAPREEDFQLRDVPSRANVRFFLVGNFASNSSLVR